MVVWNTRKVVAALGTMLDRYMLGIDMAEEM